MNSGTTEHFKEASPCVANTKMGNIKQAQFRSRERIISQLVRQEKSRDTSKWIHQKSKGCLWEVDEQERRGHEKIERRGSLLVTPSRVESKPEEEIWIFSLKVENIPNAGCNARVEVGIFKDEGRILSTKLEKEVTPCHSRVVSNMNKVSKFLFIWFENVIQI